MVDIDIRYITVLFFLFYLNGYIIYLIFVFVFEGKKYDSMSHLFHGNKMQ